MHSLEMKLKTVVILTILLNLLQLQVEINNQNPLDKKK